MKMYFSEIVNSLSEPMGMMGLVSLLLHCNALNASNPVLEFSNKTKSDGGQFALASPSLQILGGLVPRVPHDLRPRIVVSALHTSKLPLTKPS